MYLITGNPRSGTKSMTNSLKKVGLDMPHEKIGEDGTVSCFFFINSSWYPRGDYGPTHVGDGIPSDYDWKGIIHLVRHPLDCIASMRSIVGKDHQEWWRELGIVEAEGPKLKVCMEAWFYTNVYIMERLPLNIRIQIENVDKKKLGKILGKDLSSMEVLHQHKATGYLKPKELTWGMMEEQSVLLTKDIKKMTKKFGYGV